MLKNVPLFDSLPAEDVSALSRRAIKKTFPRNTILVHEGDRTDSLYAIETGKVKVFLSDEEGREILLNTHGPGEYFGEIALIDEAPRSASVMTLEDSKMFLITKLDFEDFLTRNPATALRLIKGLTLRIRSLTENVKSLALMDVYGRVARTLLNMAEQQDGLMVIPRRLTQRDIASMVGASREMVSRILKDLTLGGYISIKKNSIVLNGKLPAQW